MVVLCRLHLEYFSDKSTFLVTPLYMKLNLAASHVLRLPAHSIESSIYGKAPIVKHGTFKFLKSVLASKMLHDSKLVSLIQLWRKIRKAVSHSAKLKNDFSPVFDTVDFISYAMRETPGCALWATR